MVNRVEKEEFIEYHMVLGEFNYRLKRYREAEKSTLRAAQIAEKTGKTNARLGFAYRLLADIYWESGKKEKSYLYERKYAAFLEKVFNQKQLTMFVRGLMEMEQARTMEGYNLLQSINRAQAEKIESSRRNTTLLLTLIAVLIAGITANLYFIISLRKKNHRLLAQHKLIDHQTEEITTIANSLEKQNNYLTQLNQRKDEMIQLVSHDLRSPLRRVKGLINIMKLEKPLSDVSLDTYINKIEAEINEELSLISRILDISSIEHGEIIVHWERVDIVEMTKKIVDNFTLTAEQKSIGLELTTSSSVCWVTTDRQMFQHIVENLLSNAIKYSPASQKVHISVSETSNHFTIAVQDNGIGIDDSEQLRLFQKFGQTTNRPTAGEPSSGLGLYICKAFAEKLGGSIGLQSEKGKGTTFTVTLPKDYSQGL